ncbi:MAG TPA: tetratricopeptide repeat protein [Pontiella sp.]
MKKKQQRPKPEQLSSSAGFDHMPESSDFYSGSPTERPLYQDRPISESNRIRKTGRHQSGKGRRKELNTRELSALLAILKSGIVIILILLAFFLLYKGISIYERKTFMESQLRQEVSPVMLEAISAPDFDGATQDSNVLFSERLEIWKETERLVRSADGLLIHNNFNLAIERCQQALTLNPFHLGALERLGKLYSKQGRNVEAINTYIRLLSSDPSRSDFQELLIRALEAHEDAEAVVYMARWYLEFNPYDADVQQCLANALFEQENYEEAIDAYVRVLKDAPRDALVLEQLATAYMQVEDYEHALATLNKLVEIRHRDPMCYRRIAICNAQLGLGEEAARVLGKSIHLFGQKQILEWIQEPKLDPVREDQTFRAFTERVGGAEFRKWTEQVAQKMKEEDRQGIKPQLEAPKSDLTEDLLNKR